jgi:hypothetical protein
MSDDAIAVSGRWAIATDGLQWILQRRKESVDRRSGKEIWQPMSFVCTTKEILTRCMEEKGTPLEDARRLLAPVGERFGAAPVLHQPEGWKSVSQPPWLSAGTASPVHQKWQGTITPSSLAA